MTSLFSYIVKRVLYLIPTIIAVSFIIFALMELAPGDMIDAMNTEAMTEEDIAALRAEYNLDRSMFYRYGVYMVRLVQGDLGVGDVTGISVWNTFIRRLPNTLLLSFTALVAGVLIAVPLGIIAARKAGTIIDNITTGVTLIGMSMPIFWIGLLLLLLFSLWLGWLPAGGFDHGIRSIILPAICSGLSLTASTARQTRSGMLEVLKSDYLRTARAKGVPESTVIAKHALGNAWTPIVTAAGYSFCMQLAGSVVVEQVFAWPGIGRMAAEAVFTRDVTTATGTIILTTILYVLVQVIIDIMYAFIDPRVKAQYISAGKRKKRTSAEIDANRGGDRNREAAAGSTGESEKDKNEEYTGLKPVYVQAENSVPVYSTAPQAKEAFAEMQKNAEANKAADSQKGAIAGNFAQKQESVMRGENHEPQKSAAAGFAVDTVELVTKKYRKRSRMSDIFFRVRKNKGAMAGLVIIGLLAIMFIASLFISFESVTARNIPARLNPPSWQFIFGTDGMGRDAFLRVIYGTRYTIAIGFGTSVIAVVIGVSLGALASYYGGKSDNLIMRASDTLASIPGMLLGMVIVTVLGQSLRNLIIAVGVSSIPYYIRITRASILTVRNQEYIEAAKAIGLSNLRIIFTQALPNGLSPIIVAFSVSFGMTIIIAASLSFIGFGVPVPHPEWGAMIAMGREFMRSAPWLTTFPGLFIMGTVLAFNLLGDGLRDALDPKMKR